MEIYWETLSPAMRQVMISFGHSPIGRRFYLAGGTALALQLGHRCSVDLDFFSAEEDIPSIRQTLVEALQPFNPALADSSWGNLVFVASGVRVGFYGYGYPIVAPFENVDGVHLAGLADIGLMKLDALLGRASRKDFHDLYAICQRLLLRQLMDLAPRKYAEVRDFEAQVIKRLAFFEHADREEPVPLLHEVDWKTVKGFFRRQASEIGNSWLQ